MELTSPSSSHQASFEKVLAELRASGDMRFWNELGPPGSVEEYIQLRIDHAEGKNLPEHWIPVTTYFLMKDDELIGEVCIRHHLTEHLRNIGGHIGYWIRPSQRGQGYGKEILRLALQKARTLGIEDVLITCDETNHASRKIIEANGGMFERAQEMGDGVPKKLLFWIRDPGGL